MGSHIPAVLAFGKSRLKKNESIRLSKHKGVAISPEDRSDTLGHFHREYYRLNRIKKELCLNPGSPDIWKLPVDMVVACINASSSRV